MKEMVKRLVVEDEKSKTTRLEENKGKDNQERLIGKVFSPFTGRIIPLSEINDEVFKSGMVGKGTAILPQKGELYSPINGMVKFISETKHALIIESSEGIEVMVHVGIDTVKLNGRFFHLRTQKGAQVAMGDPLLKFDISPIEKAGFDLASPIVITNAKQFSIITVVDQEQVTKSDILLLIYQ